MKGKNAVVYFYNADGSKDCTTQAIAFDEAHAEFKALKFDVVGVRSAADADSQFVQHYSQRFVADADNSVRKQLGIQDDLFGALAGRETYVIDKSGTVKLAFNSQFQPEEHVAKALEVAQLVASESQGAGFFGSFRLPSLADLGVGKKSAEPDTDAAPSCWLPSLSHLGGGHKSSEPPVDATSRGGFPSLANLVGGKKSVEPDTDAAPRAWLPSLAVLGVCKKSDEPNADAGGWLR